MWFTCCSSQDTSGEKASEAKGEEVMKRLENDAPISPTAAKPATSGSGGRSNPRDGQTTAPRDTGRRNSKENGSKAPAPAAAAAAPAEKKEDTSAADAAREAEEKKRAEAKAKEDEETKRKEKMLRDAGGAFKRKEWGKAVELYTKYLKEVPKDVSALAGRGGAYVRGGKFKEALPDLNEALGLDEGNLFALRDRAEARFKTGDYDGAIEDFNKKLSLAPGDGRALVGRGECRQKKGDKEGAITDFELAKRLGYKGADELLKKAKAG